MTTEFTLPYVVRKNERKQKSPAEVIKEIQKRLDQGADINSNDGMSKGNAFMVALDTGQCEVAEYLIENGSDLHIVTDEERTSLMFAIKGGCVEIVKRLLAKGLDVNAKDCNGTTPLMYAIDRGHHDIMQILLSNGADLNAREDANDGWSSLMNAVKKNDKTAVEILLKKGARTDIADSEGYTALRIAEEGGNQEIAALLRIWPPRQIACINV